MQSSHHAECSGSRVVWPESTLSGIRYLFVSLFNEITSLHLHHLDTSTLTYDETPGVSGVQASYSVSHLARKYLTLPSPCFPCLFLPLFYFAVFPLLFLFIPLYPFPILFCPFLFHARVPLAATGRSTASSRHNLSKHVPVPRMC